jgi:hypothetical protein
MPFGLPKGAAGSGSRDAAGKKGERGEKKTRGGGGLINSGRRTFVPNVLGRDPRPPLCFSNFSVMCTVPDDSSYIFFPWERG